MNSLTNKFRIFRRRLLGAAGFPVCSEPLSIDVEPTVRCNLRCTFCRQAASQRKAPDMPESLFETVLDSFPDLHAVKLQGIGEPLLHPGIIQLISRAKQRGIRVTIFTNGTLLGKGMAEKLVSSGVDEINVSFDHPDSRTFETLRPGLDWQRFSDGVRNLSQCAKNKPLAVSAWTVVTKNLSGCVLRHIAAASDLGFKRIVFQLDMTKWGQENAPHLLPEPSPDVIAEVESAVNAGSDGMELSCRHTNSFSMEKPCPWPFYHTFISVEGTVQPCCIMTDPSVFTLGSIAAKPFFRLWNGRKYFAFRRTFRSQRTLKMFCRGCYLDC
jgi:MoaA/NifB/PqqE/SkfB family radical SAM enzyme